MKKGKIISPNLRARPYVRKGLHPPDIVWILSVISSKSLPNLTAKMWRGLAGMPSLFF